MTWPQQHPTQQNVWRLSETATAGNTHGPFQCVGDHCILHNPSDHHMREWPINWRIDRNLMERICPHGVGHPDPDDISPDHVHGCDGCCESATKAEALARCM